MGKFILTIFTAALISINASGQSAGNSIMLDGINDFLRVPNHSSLNPGTGSWSILMWIKPANEIRRSPLVTKRQQSGGYDQYSLGFADTDPHNPVPGKKIYYNYIDETGISERSGISIDNLLDSSWNHIAIIADKQKDSIFLYKNGIRQNYNLMYKYGSWPNIDNTESLFIGHNNMSHFFKGQIDELSIWNKPLSPSQINTVKFDTLSAAYYSTSDSGLAGYWRFDEFENLAIGLPGINDIRDLSYWHNHGDAEGGPLLITSGVPIGLIKLSGIIPEEFHLFQNYPNPFNPSTKIRFEIPHGGQDHSLQLIIYDVLGREAAILVRGQLKPGTYEVEWDGSNCSSGLYFYKLNSESFSQTRKMVLIK